MLTPIQRQNIANQRPAVRASNLPVTTVGAGYGLYTAGDPVAMMHWLQNGPPQDWYDHVWNTARFILGMPNLANQRVLYIRNAGFPSLDEYYTVAGGHGDNRTLPKINRIQQGAMLVADAPLLGFTEQSLYDWIIGRI